MIWCNSIKVKNQFPNDFSFLTQKANETIFISPWSQIKNSPVDPSRSQSLSPPSIIIGASTCRHFAILPLLFLAQRSNLVVCCTKGKAKAGDCEEGQGGKASYEAAGQQARVEVAHEGGEPVVDVVDVVWDGQQTEGGEDWEEGGHGAGHQQDDHNNHLQQNNMMPTFAISQKDQPA